MSAYVHSPNVNGLEFRIMVEEGIKLIYVAVVLVTVYLVLTIGSCSPIHCRLSLAIWGMVVVLLSTMAGFGICYALGWKKTSANDPIPLIMLGIGVDDIFVIINSLDQVSMSMPPAKRIRLAMRHAGPTITITSLTNALAFLAAMSSQLVALKSFSIFCCTCILLLYISMMTLYLPAVYWDTQRVSKRKTECFGAFCCAEDSKLFCKGRFLA